MSSRLQLRKHLYDELARTRPGRRKPLRRQIRVLDAAAVGGPDDDGSAGVREPRRPVRPHGPATAERRLP